MVIKIINWLSRLMKGWLFLKRLKCIYYYEFPPLLLVIHVDVFQFITIPMCFDSHWPISDMMKYSFFACTKNEGCC